MYFKNNNKVKYGKFKVLELYKNKLIKLKEGKKVWVFCWLELLR